MYKKLEKDKIIVKKFMVLMENEGWWRLGNKLVRVNDIL